MSQFAPDRTDPPAVDSSSVEERIQPDLLAASENPADRERLENHLERYDFASEQLPPTGNVLDIACGVGYGTDRLCRELEGISATGVDLSDAAIEFARSRYAHPHATFVQHDAMTFRPPSGTAVDGIVSLETIEHLPDPGRFVSDMVENLTPGGVFVASAPVTPSVDVNRFHLTDFTVRSFSRMFERLGLEQIDSFAQTKRFSVKSVIAKLSGGRAPADSSDNLPEDPGETRGFGALLAHYRSNPASLLRRARSLVTDGLATKYITIAWKKPE